MSDDEKNRKAIEELLPGVTQVAAATRRAWAAWVLGAWDSPGCLELRLAVMKATERYRQDVRAGPALAPVLDAAYLPEDHPQVWFELALAEAYVDEQRRREASKANAGFREAMTLEIAKTNLAIASAEAMSRALTAGREALEQGLQREPPAG